MMKPLISLFAVGLIAPAMYAQTAPILDCVEYQQSPTGPTITAHWGYVNTAGVVKSVPPGPGNFFSPGAAFQFQPGTFQAGIYHDVFQTTFHLTPQPPDFAPVSLTSSWHLQGIIETASNDPAKYCFGTNVSCWDANANGLCDPAEDVNGDGTCSARDCLGRMGATGPTGPQGPQGVAGPQGLQGPPGISPAIRTVTIASSTATATASCNVNEVMLNGGGVCTVPNTNSIAGRIASSAPSGANGWAINCSAGLATAVTLCSAKQ